MFKFNIYKNKLIKIILIIVVNFYLFFFKEHIKAFETFHLNLVKQNEYFLSNNISHFKNKDFFPKIQKEKEDNIDILTNFTFNLTNIKYSTEVKNNIVKVEYFIGFYYINKNLIRPSDLTLYFKYHVLCYNINLKTNIFITSLANIYENKNFYCTEFLNNIDEIKFGIIIYTKSNRSEYYSLNFFTYNNSKINDNYIYKIEEVFNCYKIEEVFNCSLINEEFNILIKQIYYNKSLRLKKSFIRKPLFSTKSNIGKQNQWIFSNLFNYYSCFCKGENCLFQDIPQKCKYYFYLNIIENNKHLYEKTEYLFGDFFYDKLSTDDVYPIFTKMQSQNFGAHYMTLKKDIYEKYCENSNICLTIIKDIFIDGDFLEKYLTLILRLKAVLSGSEFFFIDNLFYNIDYITYISVGHGVSFFKYFLYYKYSYYGYEKYNKILIPPSNMLVSMAIHYGWKDENIIKINLPRWDKYNDFDKIKEEGKNKNIFIMFTWRITKYKKDVSKLYFQNINGLLNNDLLIKYLSQYNITLYFTFHRKIMSKAKLQLNKNIKYIEEEEISGILSNTSLVVSDFSSIIFDLIYREKPFVIFIPDSNDPNLNNIYDVCYSKLIKDIKDGAISFLNTFFNIEDTVNKINYYIKNNFNVEPRLKEFYNNLGIEKGNNTIKFIEYLKNLN